MIRRMAQIWAEQDRPAAMNWGQTQLDPGKRQQALGGVVEVWAGTDPAAAAAFASSIENPYERHEVLEIAARRWAAQSTTEAMDWAQTLSDVDRQRATNAVLHEVAESDPARAATLYENMTTRQPALMEQIFAQMKAPLPSPQAPSRLRSASNSLRKSEGLRSVVARRKSTRRAPQRARKPSIAAPMASQ